MRGLYFVLLFPCAALSLNNGLGRVPPMGWNSWYHFGCGVNQTIVQESADALVSSGLYKSGYEYVNIDDCWAKSRDSHGVIQPDPVAFPDMPGLVKHVHSVGLKFGLYSDAGSATCAGRPGSLGHEQVDADTYASWGVDFLKYDNCNSEGIPPEKRYPVMRDALNKTGRPILYSLCEWGVDNPATWAVPVGNCWRTTGDTHDSWDEMISHADLNEKWWSWAGPGGWNDPDMLQAGNGGMTVTEYKTQFSLWCLMKAPLLIGGDVRNMDNDTFQILSNSELIAVNQDRLGVQGNKTKSDGVREVWAGPLANNSHVVILLNRGNDTTTVTADWKDFGLNPVTEASVRDLWQHKDIGTMKGSVSVDVPSHGVAAYRITPIATSQ